MDSLLLLPVRPQYTTMMQEKSKLSQELTAIKGSSEATASSASARALGLEKELAELKVVLLGTSHSRISVPPSHSVVTLWNPAASTCFRELFRMVVRKM